MRSSATHFTREIGTVKGLYTLESSLRKLVLCGNVVLTDHSEQQLWLDRGLLEWTTLLQICGALTDGPTCEECPVAAACCLSGDSQGQTAGAHVFRDRSCQRLPLRSLGRGTHVSSRTALRALASLRPSGWTPTQPPGSLALLLRLLPSTGSHQTGCSLVGIPSSRPLRTPFQRTIHLPSPAHVCLSFSSARHVLETDSTAKEAASGAHNYPRWGGVVSTSGLLRAGLVLNQQALMSLPWHPTSVLKQSYLKVTQEREDKHKVRNAAIDAR